MPKNILFSANMPLITSDINQLLQDGQIVNAKGQSASDVMSQKIVTHEINNLDNTKVNYSQIVQVKGDGVANVMSQKVVTDELSNVANLNSNKVNNSQIVQSTGASTSNILSQNAVTILLNNLTNNTNTLLNNKVSKTDSISASQITISNGGSFGNASTLQGALTYIASKLSYMERVFNGENVTKLSATSMVATNISVSATVTANKVVVNNLEVN